MTTKLNQLPFKNLMMYTETQAINQSHVPVIKPSSHQALKADHNLTTTVVKDEQKLNIDEKFEEPNSYKLGSDSQKIFDLYESAKKDDLVLETKKEEIVQDEMIENLIFQDLNITKPEPDTDLKKVEDEVIKSEAVNDKQDQLGSSLSLNTSQQNDSLQMSELNRALSNQSIASTLTNTSQNNNNTVTQSQTKKKDTIEIAEDPIPDWVKEDVHVIVSTTSVMNKPGFVRYIGPTKFGTGTWIGVELEQLFGKNDGAVKGVRYFICPENKGVFVRADKLTMVVNKIS